jgi:predicted ATPase
MFIKSVALKGFKRFHDLRIELPPGIQLVVLAGPNGTGKSSLFDAFQVWHRANGGFGVDWDTTYFPKTGELDNAFAFNKQVIIDFHDELPKDQQALRRTFAFRSAYRNDPQFEVSGLSKQEPLENELRFNRMIENDAAVARNYQRLAAQALEDVFIHEDPATTIGMYRTKVIGTLREALQRIFPALTLNDFGNPLTTGTFRFDKGNSQGFLYKNLSGGEKAAFDLLLDFVLKAPTFVNTIYCIDEPEAHLNSRVQCAVLDELYRCLPGGCQLWLASHSIGMMRRARDIEAANPGSVAFLDFYETDFDQPQVLQPTRINRRFWERVLDVALDDLSTLVAPQRIVVCEGSPIGSSTKNTSHDAICYNSIFETEFPDTRFISGGNSHDVQSDRLALVAGLNALVAGAKVIRLIDRDDHSPDDITDLKKDGIRVLGRRHLESFLYDDAVLAELCKRHNKSEVIDTLLQDKKDALATVAGQGKSQDDIKSAAGMIYNKAKQRLSLVGVGNDAKAFERNVLAGLIDKDMDVYKQLKANIFDSD